MYFFDPEVCLFPNCFKDNVKSHAISEKFSLYKLSENFHLYHFSPHRFCRDKKKPEFKKIGTTKATAHIGFCEEHENLFECLDSKEITDSNEVLLQVYRSLGIIYHQEMSASISLYKLNSVDGHKDISRDCVVDYLKSIKKEKLISYLDQEKFLDLLQKKIHSLISEKIDTELIEIKRLFDYLPSVIKSNQGIKVEVGKFTTLNTQNMNYTIFYYKTDFQIPVAMNSIVKGDFSGGNNINIFSIVVPYESSNLIIGLIPNEILRNDYYVEKINSYFSNDLRVVQYIESVMLSSDGWYLKPSIIENMTEKRRRFFCEDCMFINERKFLDLYDFSIFDDLKLKLIPNCEKELFSERLSKIPTRDNYSIRYDRMIKKMYNKIY